MGRRIYDQITSQPRGRFCDANPTSKTLASAQTHPPQNRPQLLPSALSSPRPTYTASRLFFSAPHPPLVIPPALSGVEGTAGPRRLRAEVEGSRQNLRVLPILDCGLP